MNDQISWDPSLVKKFSTSNHFKLLNQLRNEVIKYPLNNKRKTKNNQSLEKKTDSKINTNISGSNNVSISKKSNQNKDLHRNQSTVSFNNSKNFSIYKNINDEPKEQIKENISVNEKISKDDSVLSTTFNDRLKQIDMK
tara:strand:- start:66 stop:482 length:417 start_codon:yes stop_codon:yes gene_type:complete